MKKYLVHRHYVPKGFYRCKSLNCFGEGGMRDEAVDHEMDLYGFEMDQLCVVDDFKLYGVFVHITKLFIY